MAGFLFVLNYGALLWCAVSLVFITSLATDTCPDSCRCRGNSLKCTPDVNGGTRLVKVPSDLLRFNMFHIKYANFSRNELQQIEPGDFYGLPRVVRLDLRHNRLRALLRNGFSGLEDLATLELSHNFIRYIDRLAFEGLPNVHKIDLSHNEITFIEDESFKTKYDLGSLLVLDLSFNNIHDLHGRTFLGLESLRELYLNHNAMQKIRPDVFTPLENLELVYLGSNFINCTCDWLNVLSNLQSRDIDVMDTSEALSSCTDSTMTCELDYSEKDSDDQRRVPTDPTVEDLRPPETGVPSAHDADEEAGDRERRRMLAALFRERIGKFPEEVMGREGDGSTTESAIAASRGSKSEEFADDQIVDITKRGDSNVTINTTRHASDAKTDIIIADASNMMKDVLQLLFPPGGFFNATGRTPPKAPVGPSGVPEPGRVILGQIAEARRAVTELRRKAAIAPTPFKSGHGTTASAPPLTFGTRLPMSALSRPEVEIPFFAVMGIFVFVCIAAGAIAMFSGLCRNTQRCDCSWLSAISEKLTMRKEEIDRQSRKATGAKGDFFKMHGLAKQAMDSSATSTNPDKMATQLAAAADEHAVVSVTPLVLTDEFPDKSGTAPPKSQPGGQRKTLAGLLGYLKSRLSSARGETALKEAPETSPRDEITLFDISVRGSTSEPRAPPAPETGIRVASERDGLPARSTDARAEAPELPTNQKAESKPPADDSALACDIDSTKENVGDERIPVPSAVESDDKIGVRDTSSDLRWYARECLSNQRMMTQARTQSMTSSNDQPVKKGDLEEDGIW